MNEESQDLLTIAQIAHELGITSRALVLAIKQGRLKARKYGAQWLVTRAAFEEYRQTQKHPGGRPRKIKDQME